MRMLLAAAGLLSLISSPALATGSLVCRTAGADPVEVRAVVGHASVSAIVSARLHDDGVDMPVQVAQSWLDSSEIRLDLVDPQALRHELRIEARRNGSTYDGTLSRLAKRRWVRCREG